MVSFPFTSLPIVFLIIISLGSTSLANFYSDFDITWGDNRGKILDNGNLLTLSLDNSSGAGFKSRNDYLFGNISMQLKLIRGNSVGTVTTFYLSSEGSKWDEVDFEFLGNLSGEPYILHTNVFTQGIGGKEQQFYLWFDPTADFHTYSFIWNPKRILFFVDGIPIREFKNIESIGVPFPKNQPMKVQCSLWHSNTWATRGGRLKTDWSLSPFTASYKNFEADACVVYSGLSSCAAPANSFGDPHWVSEQLGEIGYEKLRRVQKKYMIYDYCSDHKRFTQGFPTECRFFV